MGDRKTADAWRALPTEARSNMLDYMRLIKFIQPTFTEATWLAAADALESVEGDPQLEATLHCFGAGAGGRTFTRDVIRVTLDEARALIGFLVPFMATILDGQNSPPRAERRWVDAKLRELLGAELHAWMRGRALERHRTPSEPAPEESPRFEPKGAEALRARDYERVNRNRLEPSDVCPKCGFGIGGWCVCP